MAHVHQYGTSFSYLLVHMVIWAHCRLPVFSFAELAVIRSQLPAAAQASVLIQGLPKTGNKQLSLAPLQWTGKRMFSELFYSFEGTICRRRPSHVALIGQYNRKSYCFTARQCPRKARNWLILRHILACGNLCCCYVINLRSDLTGTGSKQALSCSPTTVVTTWRPATSGHLCVQAGAVQRSSDCAKADVLVSAVDLPHTVTLI